MSDILKTLLKIDYVLAKQDVAPISRAEPADDPRAGKLEIDKPKASWQKEHPSGKGKVQTKIYELVHRGGRTFERARTAWVNPHVAERLNQRKVATDWIRTLGNYIPIYFVGGYIRDKFFKKVSKDVDIISLSPLASAKEIFNGLSIKFEESSNAFARVKFHVGDLKVDMIATTQNELLENLGQRDFTINAVAQSVTGQFYDPFHGLDDIKMKVLRTPGGRSAESFKEDPVRLLRGVRMLSDFPIKAHPSLLRALPDSVQYLKNVKPKRIGFEFAKVMQAEKPSYGLKFMAKHNMVQYICADLNSIIGLKQRGRRGDVWDHTMKAVKNAKSQDLILNLAILYHDTGKAKVEKVKGHFPDHARESGRVARSSLLRLGFNKGIIERVARLVENHKFVDSALKGDSDEDEYRKLILTLRGDLKRFFELSRADATSAGHNASDVTRIEKRVQRMKESLPDDMEADSEEELLKLDDVPDPRKPVDEAEEEIHFNAAEREKERPNPEDMLAAIGLDDVIQRMENPVYREVEELIERLSNE
ncbi:hypothetical protein CMI37_05015 [Candidatus Pacearchaeota archaeon]|nr:hypothetical protein [Candidatus Pacearchaeota archaeon]|tara:strand:+ start:6650 stop:8251 length:1602 start_codon:yes stop_codon:yes gene_type:complete